MTGESPVRPDLTRAAHGDHQLVTESRYSTALSVPATIESIRPATRFLLDTARVQHVTAASDALFEVALGEVLTNAVKHGGCPLGGTILCEVEVTDRAFVVRVFDCGSGFDMSAVALPAPDRDAPELLAESGYGLAIVRAVFSSVQSLWRNGRFGVELSLPLAAVEPSAS
jgi:anti-sigma regulatory factor (Ser/Thr protein kinase)